MSEIIQFNNRLLDSLKNEWKGLFYEKFVQGFAVLQEQKDLNLATEAMFPESKIDVAEPSANELKRYGQGNPAKDIEIIQFLDNEIFNLIQGNRNVSFQIPSEARGNETIQKYWVLISLLRGEDLRSFVGYKLKITSLNDLSFLGCCGLLHAQKLQNTNLQDPYFIDYQIDETTQNEINYLQINDSVIEEISSSLLDQEKVPNLLEDFLHFNKGNITLQKSSLQLKNILPEVLSSASFLWQENTFNVSPEEVESMSDSQKMMTLIQNKTAVIEKCFQNITETHLLNRDFRAITSKFEKRKQMFMSALQLGNTLTELLNTKTILQESYSKYYSDQRRQKKQLLEIAETMGVEAKRAANKLLELFSMRDLELQSFKEASETDNFFMNLFSDYKQSVIETAKEKAKILDINEKIDATKKELQKTFYVFTQSNSFLSSFSENEKLNVLKTYATFSFVILNKDLFPDIPMKSSFQKKGAQKLSAVFDKMHLRKSLKKWKNNKSPIEELESSDAFQYILNNQIEKVFKAYRKPSASYRYKKLSDRDLELIVKSSKLVESLARQGNQEAIGKFLKLENVLYNLLVNQNVFQEALNQANTINPGKSQSVQSHCYACIIFANNPQYTQQSSTYIQTLLNSLAECITDDGIKNKIVTSNKKIIEAAQRFALDYSPEDVEKITENEIAGKNYEQLRNKAIEVKRFPLIYSQEQEEHLDKAKSRLKELVDDVERKVNTTDSYLSEIIGLDDVLFEKFSQKESYKEFLQYFAKRSLKLFNDLSEDAFFIITPERSYPSDWPRITLKNVLEEFRWFVINNNIDIKPRSGRRLVAKTPDISDEEDLLIKAFVANRIAKAIEETKESLYTVVPKDFDPNFQNQQINIFSNQTLFQLYEKINVMSVENQKSSEALYNEFLPIFATSFVGSQKLFGREYFVNAKKAFIKQLPGVASVLDASEAFLEQNQAKINELNEYLKNEVLKNKAAFDQNSGLIPEFIQSIMQDAQNLFSNYIGDYQGVKNYVLVSTIVSAGLFLALSGAGYIAVGFASGAAVTFLSFIGVAFLKNSVLPFLEKMVNSLWEGLQSLIGVGNYDPSSPMNYLLKTLEFSLKVERNALFKFNNLRDKIQFGGFVNQVYEILQNTSHDLTSFRENVNKVVPEAVGQANFSVMSLNMMCFLNSQGFQILPSKILKSADHPEFEEAVKDYLQTYKTALANYGQDFEGVKEISYSNETAYSRFLKTKSIYLNFAENSPVGKVFNRATRFKLERQDILPYEDMNPSLIAKNLKSLVDAAKNLSSDKKLFEGKMRPIFQELHASFDKPLRKVEKEQFVNAFISSYEIVRYGFSLARSTKDANQQINTSQKEWLKATQEDPRSIFNSRLFNDSMNFLANTAFAFSTTNAPDAQELLRLVDELKSLKDDYLSSDILILPSSEAISELHEQVLAVIGSIDSYPAIAIPGLVELEKNKSLFIPSVIWMSMKANLRRENEGDASQLLEVSNASKLVYLTDQDLDVFFDSPDLRGGMFSVWTVNALENIARRYSNEQLKQFLGYASARSTAKQAIPFKDLSLINKFPFLQQRKPEQVPAIQYGQAPIPLQQQFVKPNEPSREVDPRTGQSQAQYDPENRGLPPEQARIYNQSQLPQGRQNLAIEPPPMAAMGQNNQNPQMSPMQNVQSNQMQPETSASQMPLMSIQADPSQVMQPQLLPAEQRANASQEAEGKMMLNVGADGRSYSSSVGANNQQFSNELRDAAANARQDIQSMRNEPSNLPDSGQGPYQNLINQNFNPIAPEQPQMPYTGALAIGAGAALGAGLLAYGLSGSDNKRKKK